MELTRPLRIPRPFRVAANRMVRYRWGMSVRITLSPNFDTARAGAVALPEISTVRVPVTIPIWAALTPP